MTALAEAPHAPRDFDVYDHAIQDDPYPWYARLREESPVHHNTAFDYWILSRHADVHWAVRDDAVLSNRMGVTLDAVAWSPDAHVTMSFLAMDPPEQIRLRRLVSQGFTPRRINELAARIQEITESYLDQAVGAGSSSLDWIADVAGRVPMDVISEMLGVPESDRVEVRRLADLLVQREDGVRDVPQQGIEAAVELMDYYRALISDRKQRPADDLVSALLCVEEGGDRMTDQEVQAFLLLMVVAGNETTTKLLGNALYHLAADVEQRAAVFDDAARGQDLIDGWIEETLRYDTSTQFLARLVTRDFERHGVTVPAGAKLLIAPGAANHDERVFTAPERYDIRRDPAELGQILSFGGGRHFCLGANLARLEARIVLRELVKRVGTVDVHHDRAVRFYSANVRGFTSLPITVEAR